MQTPPLTELDAVNTLLVNMGEAPIETLSGDLPLDALVARQTLNEIITSVLTRGWAWNNEVYTLSPDTNGNVVLPPNTIAVKAFYRNLYFTMREGKLYRIAQGNNGFHFTDPQTVVVTTLVPFEEMPVSARSYITARASRIFQARTLGDEMLLRNDSTEEQYAWSVMRAEDNENRRRNLGSTKSMQLITNRQNGAGLIV